MDFKRMAWHFTEDGRLVCVQGVFTYVITEHKVNTQETCGYDVQAFLKGTSKPIYSDFMGSFFDTDEFFDLFTYMAETSYQKIPVAL
jgi:hypothetical protein